jgi:hypothetical protein
MQCLDDLSLNEDGDDSNEEAHNENVGSIKSVQELPYDILFAIMSTLSIRDLCMIEKVNMLFNDISQKVLLFFLIERKQLTFAFD